MYKCLCKCDISSPLRAMTTGTRFKINLTKTLPNALLSCQYSASLVLRWKGALSAHLLISISHVSVLDFSRSQGMLWYIVMFNFQFSNDTQCQPFLCAYLLSVGTLCGEVCFDTVLAFLMLYLLACWPWVSQYYSGWCEASRLQCSFCLGLWEAGTPAACCHGCYTFFK